MTEHQSLSKPSTVSMSAAAAAVPGRTAPSSARATAATAAMTRERAATYVWAAVRLALGWTFLWPFFDKLIGLGHETPSAKSWLNGGNPTKGFLSGSIGPFSGIYHSIAGDTIVNVLFMAGLLFVAVGLLLGIFMRLACGAGALMVLLMWSASLPPANDVFMDDHVIYAMVFAGLALVGAGNTLGLGRWWSSRSFVRSSPWLG
jgi:thiosulfate dehydrogenase [quinone] large subunit